MKKTILFIAVALVSAIGVRAQGGGGGGQQRSPEERVKQTMERLADLKLDKDQTEKTTAVFKDYYEARQKMMEEMRAGGGQPDREQMREKGQKLSGERDEKLKKIKRPNRKKTADKPVKEKEPAKKAEKAAPAGKAAKKESEEKKAAPKKKAAVKTESKKETPAKKKAATKKSAKKK